MAEEHWFDTVNKLLAFDAPRRGVLGALALTFGQRLDATDASTKKGGKGGGKKKERNKKKDKGRTRKGQKDGPARCGQGACARELPEDQFVACAEKCGRCRIRDQFCVIGPDAEHPVKHATCCLEHQQCCQDSLACCDKTGKTCCGGGCCPEGSTCCGGFCCGTNYPYTTCCDGQCTNTEYSSAHCGACGNPVAPKRSAALAYACCAAMTAAVPVARSGQSYAPVDAANIHPSVSLRTLRHPCGPDERCVDGICGTECCVGEDGLTICTETTGPNAATRTTAVGAISNALDQTCTAGMCGCPENSGTVWCPSQELCINPSQC